MGDQLKSDDTAAPNEGVLLKSAGSDVIRYDETGLVLRLSDQVISDISMRLAIDPNANIALQIEQGADAYLDANDHLPDLEAWDLKSVGEWLFFTADLPGKQGVRGFRKLMDGDAILADTPGPLQGILGIGGARAALATSRKCDFPQHVVAPADDIGAVGHAGVETAQELDELEHLRTMTQDAMVAENLLQWRKDTHRSLPLFVTRVETDTAGTAAELATGAAHENLQIAARNLVRSAARMHKKAAITAVTLNYSFEDQSGSAAAYRDGMLSVMQDVEKGLVSLGFHKPQFIMQFDAGSPDLTRDNQGDTVIQGQWDLGWNHEDHAFLFSAPSYMFALDEYDRPTDDARCEMAEMTAAALCDSNWQCPNFMLAETLPSNDCQIRVTAKAACDLVIDRDDPLGSGVGGGFFLQGGEIDAKVIALVVDDQDNKSLILTFDQPISGDHITLGYGFGSAPTGAIRDTWELDSKTERKLHRWALPCLLEVHKGAQND